jgi:hypothetical protein
VLKGECVENKYKSDKKTEKDDKDGEKEGKTSELFLQYEVKKKTFIELLIEICLGNFFDVFKDLEPQQPQNDLNSLPKQFSSTSCVCDSPPTKSSSTDPLQNINFLKNESIISFVNYSSQISGKGILEPKNIIANKCSSPVLSRVNSVNLEDRKFTKQQIILITFAVDFLEDLVWKTRYCVFNDDVVAEEMKKFENEKRNKQNEARNSLKQYKIYLYNNLFLLFLFHIIY